MWESVAALGFHRLEKHEWGEHKVTTPQKFARHALVGQGDQMVTTDFDFPFETALHALGGNTPERLVAIQVFELFPTRAAQLAGSHRGQCNEAHGPGRDPTGIFILHIA
ncbi:MAG: hypothetical protein JWO15_2396 [Sphingomonadales bacterium]|nr:hypothetical protein [Sphingomonadales bacterium]